MTGRAAARAGLVRVDEIRFHPANVRRELGDLRDLTESVRRYGVLQPVVVERYGSSVRLRMGHRRLAAARLAGLRTVPALIYAEVLGEREFVLQAVQENTARSGLAAADKRYTVQRLRELGCSWRRIGEAFHVAPRTAAGWVTGDNDDDTPRAVNPRRRALSRLIAKHPEEFDQLLAQEHERRDLGSLMAQEAA